MKKIRLHPFFIAVCILMSVSGHVLTLFYTLFAVLGHELAHYLSAKNRGYTATRLTIMPYGAVLGINGLSDKDTLAIAAAGPMFNLAAALLTVALWWIFPDIYSATLLFFRVNMAIGIFNLLPIYPLDGSRIVMSFTKNKQKCLKIMRIVGYICSAVTAILYIVSAFFTISYSLMLASIMFYIGADYDAEKEKYIQLCREIYYLKDFSRPLPKKELYVHTSLKIGALMRELKNDYVYFVHVIDGNMNVLATLEGAELEKLFFMDKNSTVKKALQLQSS